MQSKDTASTILLVDDEPLIRSAYRRTLLPLGASVLLADGPIEGLAILETQPVDVVLADYRMPEMNGDAFLEMVRDRWPTVVRVLMTAYTDLDIVEDVVRRGGIFRFLTKPCDAAKLKRAVSDALAESRDALECQQRSAKLELDLHSYQHLFRHAPDPLIIADPDGHVIEVNDAFIANCGGDRQQALRKRPYLFTSSDASAPPWDVIRREIERSGSFSTELHREGRYLMLGISGIRNDRGELYAYAATEKDVTTQRTLERASRAAQYEVILALAKLAEYRDPETGAHLERMRRYSRLLAQQLSTSERYSGQIDSQFVEAVFFSSPLHDIGKVGIPDAVLLKPGKLTRDEWTLMKEHAQIGAEVLSAAGETLSQKIWLSMAKTIAAQHHEKYDGSGYPAGLRGSEIHISARIVALADAYDAITSKRVYKDAIPHDEARRRIVSASGSHFDPDVVAAFLACEERFIAIRNSYCDPEPASAQLKAS